MLSDKTLAEIEESAKDPCEYSKGYHAANVFLLLAEVKRCRAVVDAARSWRSQNWSLQASGALALAVDAYEQNL